MRIEALPIKRIWQVLGMLTLPAMPLGPQLSQAPATWLLSRGNTARWLALREPATKLAEQRQSWIANRWTRWYPSRCQPGLVLNWNPIPWNSPSLCWVWMIWITWFYLRISRMIFIRWSWGFNNYQALVRCGMVNGIAIPLAIEDICPVLRRRSRSSCPSILMYLYKNNAMSLGGNLSGLTILIPQSHRSAWCEPKFWGYLLGFDGPLIL